MEAGTRQCVGSDLRSHHALQVTRRSSSLFTLMAECCGPHAINDRLMLFETTEFTTTPNPLLALISRIVKDRDRGQSFFNDHLLMDVERLSTGAPNAIAITPMLPPLAPFERHEWPWITTATDGSGPSSLQQAMGSKG